MAEKPIIDNIFINFYEGKTMKSILKSILFICIFAVICTPSFGVTTYTTAMMTDYISQLENNPHVFPTASDQGGLVLGQSHGWTRNPYVPKNDLYGFLITNPASSQPQTRVVMISGNHNTEYSGNWALQGMINFLVSNDARAVQLRSMAEFYVYPMVNPDGRYLKSGLGNPELSSMGYTNHNRVWDKTGISTIDTFTSAMIFDTGGATDYFFDFHDDATLNCLVAQTSLATSKFCKSLCKLDSTISIYVDDGEEGMARLWAMSDTGLSATYAFTPEFTHYWSDIQYQQMGQNYAIAMYNTLTPEPMTIVLLGLGAVLMRRKR
jgi:predicted deacylase